MPDQWSQAWKEAAASNTHHVVMLTTLEMLHPSFAVPLRVVPDNVDFTARLEPDAPQDAGQDVLFVAYPVNIKEPEISPTAGPRGQIRIDNVSREIEDNLRAAAKSLDPIEVLVRYYLADRPQEGPQGPVLQMILADASADSRTATGYLQVFNPANMPFPTKRYQLNEWPGLVT